MGFSRATSSLKRQFGHKFDRLDDCVVNPVQAMQAVRFSNEAKRTTNLLLKSPVAIGAIDRDAGVPERVVSVSENSRSAPRWFLRVLAPVGAGRTVR